MNIVRKCANNELKAAYKIAAQVVKDHGECYLPIFKRLHEELEKSDHLNLLKSLALQIAVE